MCDFCIDLDVVWSFEVTFGSSHTFEKLFGDICDWNYVLKVKLRMSIYVILNISIYD